MRERDITFKEAVNDAIRSGLGGTGRGARPPATIPRNIGVPRMDLTRALEIAGELEDEQIVSRLADGR